MKQKTLEEAAESFFNKRAKEEGFENWTQIIVQQEWKFIESFPIEFAKWQQERSYSEEEMLNFAWFLLRNVGQYSDDRTAHFEGKYLEQFKNK